MQDLNLTLATVSKIADYCSLKEDATAIHFRLCSYFPVPPYMQSRIVDTAYSAAGRLHRCARTKKTLELGISETCNRLLQFVFCYINTSSVLNLVRLVKLEVHVLWNRSRFSKICTSVNQCFISIDKLKY